MLDHPFNAAQTVRERIRQRRAQMLAHSYLYYELDRPIVSDDTWQRWANELRDLQAMAGSAVGYFDWAFGGWTGATGHDLPLRHPAVAAMAQRLIRYAEQV